ncbi:MAG: TonB-dependent receptor [Flavobacteriia bacterium]|nr:TonB-dependent receptor [Flavobacteriia bacterium]
MKKSLLTYLFISLGYFTYSQGEISVNGESVDVNTKRTVEPAMRLTENPKVIDSIKPTKVIEYPLMKIQFPTVIVLDTIKPASIKTVDKLPQLYHSYVKLGIGSKLMPLGEVYFDGNRSRRYIYGVHAKHLSSFGNIPNYAPSQYDRTNGNIFGAINEKNYALKGDIHYGNKGFHYYGIQNDSINRDSIAQRFNDFGGDFSFDSHKKDSANMNYLIGLSYNNFQSKKPVNTNLAKWKANENYFAINGLGTYKTGKEIYNVELGLRYNGYKYGVADTSISLLDTGIVSNNTIIQLKPSITSYLKNNRFKVKIGVDLTLDAHDKTKFYIYPIAELKYSLFNDLFIPYIGLKGGIKQNTFKSVSTENEFVLTNIILKNESTAIDAFIGFKGTITKRISFNASASFASFKNKLLFVTDTTYSVRNKFNVTYDDGFMTTIEGALSYQLVEKLKVDAIAKYYSYALTNNTYAWNLPQFQITTRAHYNLYDHFIFNLDLNFEGGRKALIYTKESNTTIENNQYAKNLGLVSDINLSIEYRYNSRISAFIQGNNLVGQRYKRWYNTPVQGIQVMGGVTFRF